MINTTTTNSRILFLFFAAATIPVCCFSFSTASVSYGRLLRRNEKQQQLSQKTSITTMDMGLFGADNKDPSNNSKNILQELFQPNNQNNNNNNNNGPKTIMTIPVQNIKPRPLRFFIQIYIVGQQNTQQQDSKLWLPRETETEGGLQVYYKDGTGMCNIELEGNNIKIERHGQRPSLEYMLQESVMLHGLLDELYKVAFDDNEDVKDSDRLLIIDETVIDKARETLPARQE